jgi:hypothetical protein
MMMMMMMMIYKTSILLFVLYGCETWSLTLREEHGLRYENSVLRRIFGPNVKVNVNLNVNVKLSLCFN